MFTTETARELGLLKGATSTQVFTASDKIKAKQQKASYLSIFEHTVEDIDVEVNEYVGYLGLDFLNQFKDLSVNFENQQITLTK